MEEKERIRRTLCQGWLPNILPRDVFDVFSIVPDVVFGHKCFFPFGTAVTAGFWGPVGDELVVVDIVVLHPESDPCGSAFFPVGGWSRGACDQWLLLGVIKGRHDLESSAFARGGADVVPVVVIEVAAIEVASDLVAFNHLRRGAIAYRLFVEV